MICDICGENKVLTLRRDYILDGWERVVYYCMNCKMRWVVIKEV